MKQTLPSAAGPIGIFDSGYGGLTILSKIREALPQYDYIYLGDNARAPYGTRSFEIVYEFLERAYNQFKNHDFNKLAKIQDKFITEDPIYGTPGRENHRNYNRMEYDYNDRFDDKGKEDVEKEVADKTELTVNKLLNAFKDHGWALNNTATAVGNKPITQKDYDKQIKM
jgi:hypothetical protein